jgi:hypothetical protein
LFLVKFNNKYDTYHGKTKQCDKGKHRSLGDIHLVCNTYYPGTKQEEVKEILLNFGSNLVGHRCKTIGKRVYSHEDLHPWFTQYSKNVKDEYGDTITYKKKDTNLEHYKHLREK